MTLGDEFKLSADALRRAAHVIEGRRSDDSASPRRAIRPAVPYMSRGALLVTVLATGAAANVEFGRDSLRASDRGGSIGRTVGSAGDLVVASRLGALPEAQSETKMRNTVRFIAAAANVIGATTAGASAQQAVQWRVEDGGNGHWYQATPRTEGALSWNAARTMALAMGGDLVELESAAELSWVMSAVGSSPVNWDQDMGPWIGAMQSEAGSEPGGGWHWVSTGKPVLAELWQNGQPSNSVDCGGDEAYANLWPSPFNAKLADMVESGRCVWHPAVVRAGLIEWSADCNGDGIVDYGQILSGQLVDADSNGVPDSCEADPCPADITGNNLVDGVDLAAILGAWGTNGQNQYDCDITDDGIVDGEDLAYVLSGWGSCQ